jgi:GMP synthase (glutamine-hydrolysing)
MYVHFVQHESYEAPGAYLKWANARGHLVSFSRVYEQAPLPDASDLDMLIVMGGPQSPTTPRAECSYFDAEGEIDLIKDCIQSDRVVIGVCLGAQLIGEALGASYEPSPEREIGVFPIYLTDTGLVHENVKDFGDSLLVGHWHNDMPGLTPDSRVLAMSEGCPRQIIEYSPLVYGFQCHMEFDSESIEPLIASDETVFTQGIFHGFIQSPAEIRSHSFEEMNEKLFLFLDKLSEQYKLGSHTVGSREEG